MRPHLLHLTFTSKERLEVTILKRQLSNGCHSQYYILLGKPPKIIPKVTHNFTLLLTLLPGILEQIMSSVGHVLGPPVLPLQAYLEPAPAPRGYLVTAREVQPLSRVVPLNYCPGPTIKTPRPNSGKRTVLERITCEIPDNS